MLHRAERNKTMSEEKKELTKKQMEKAKGGLITGYTGSPHCKSCGGETAPFGSFYRCITAGCKQQGKNKNASEVSWF